MSDSRLTAISSRCDIKATVQRQSADTAVPSRRPKRPSLDAADCRQYREGRDAFLRAAGKLPARLGPQVAGS
jgi:hypothetical protein